MTFTSRQEAGYELGRRLAELGIQADLVLGLPRGGVVVAAEVAMALELPLAVLVVRKIGHPRFREFAVGALAEGGVVLLDQDVLKRSLVDLHELQPVIDEESERLGKYSDKFGGEKRPGIAGKRVILVDDGLATGATMEAAVHSARQQAAAETIVTVPVASVRGKERLENVCDRLISLMVDPKFEAVGQYYQEFSQTSDSEVVELLAGH